MNSLQAEDGLIGISLRESRLRMTEVAFGADGQQVTNLAQSDMRVPFTFEAIEDRSSIRTFGDDINELYEARGFRNRKIALSIDSDFVLIKKIPIDISLDNDDLADHVKWETKQLMISDIDDFVLDYEILDYSEHSNLVKQIIVVTVRKAVVDFLREIFATTNLSLQAIDVDVFSAQRVLANNYNFAADQKVALVDIRNKNIQFSILYHGFYLAIEVIFPSDDGADIGASRDEHIARVISKELRRIILDNKLGKSVEDLSEVFLYGENVEDGIVEQLSQAHNVNLHRLNPFKKIPFSETLATAEVTDHPETFVISVGAAIKGL